MTDKDSAKQGLLNLVAGKEFSLAAWQGTSFAGLKIASPTEKGNIAEDFFKSMLEACGYTDVIVARNRRGPYNVRLRSNGETVDFGVVLATQDTSGSFQFNGLKLDSEYDYAFCLGILPEGVKFLVFPVSYLTDHEDYRTVPMNRGSDLLKLTRTEAQLMEFDSFCRVIQELLE